MEGLLPGDSLLEEVLLVITEEANVDKGLDELGETVVANGSSDDGLGIGDAVTIKGSAAVCKAWHFVTLPLAVTGAVTVSVGDEVES